MSQEVTKEELVTLSPRSGKRSRDDKEEDFPTADECVKARDFDLSKECAPAGVDENGREDQATSGENLIVPQSGKRIKCELNHSQHENEAENMNTSKKGETLSEVEAGSQFHCTVCSVKCTSVKDYGTHVAGKRHARALMGVVTPRSGKAAKKLAARSKAKGSSPKTANLHEDVSVMEQAIVEGSITSFDQAGKGLLSSCTGCTNIEVGDLQAFRIPDLNIDKDVILEQQHTKEGAFMETLASQIMKSDSTSTIALHDIGNGKLCEPLTNGNTLNVLADGLAKFSNNIEGQHNNSVMDLARCKSNSECIARALAAAYQKCACPGLDGLLKSGTYDKAAGCMDSPAAGPASSNTTDGMVSMHTHCFMNLLHDIQVKVMEDLFLHVLRDERIRGFLPEAWLPNGAPLPSLPPCEKNLNCTVCRVEYGSKSDLDQHVMGRKHTSLVTRLHSRCHVCNVNCNSEKDFEKHVNGKKHGSKLRLVQKRVAF